VIVERVLRAVFKHRDIDHGGDLYLRRFYVGPEVRGWQLMLHKLCRPDRERIPHDHPWDFATLCLSGGYTEEVADAGGGAKFSNLMPGEARLRSAEHTHRIVKVFGVAWTLVLSGPRRRTWGFWDGKNFTDWRTYLKVPADYHPLDDAKRVVSS